MYKVGDLFEKDDTIHIITTITNGYIDEAIPLRDYIEKNYIIQINKGIGIETITIKELVGSLMDKYIRSRKYDKTEFSYGVREE